MLISKKKEEEVRKKGQITKKKKDSPALGTYTIQKKERKNVILYILCMFHRLKRKIFTMN